MPVESLREFPVLVTLPVEWGDQDAMGHVNNTIYLRWSETARIDYLLRLGVWRNSPTEQFGPILASITCHFRLAVTFPDTVHVGTRVTAIGKSSFRMAHSIVSEKHGAVVAELESTLVWLDYHASKSVHVPAAMRHSIEKLEGREFR